VKVDFFFGHNKLSKIMKTLDAILLTFDTFLLGKYKLVEKIMDVHIAHRLPMMMQVF
jgi:hypothetical protein